MMKLEYIQDIKPSFFLRSPLVVAPELLGKILVHEINGNTLSGRIVEVEAYLAAEDESSHAFRGRTKRNAALFTAGGHAYVYHIHRYYCLDVVTQTASEPTSVLIRALEPMLGIAEMKKFRQKEHLRELTSGPGKLCQALNITSQCNGVSLVAAHADADVDGAANGALLYLASDGFVPTKIVTTTRVGISRATDKPWRFYIANNPYISKK